MKPKLRFVDVPDFPPAPAFPVAPQRKALADVALQSVTQLTRRDRKRELLDATAAANAVKELDRLPNAGESLHCIMRGNFHFWSIVPAVAAMASPASIDTLHIATLGTNHANTASLCRLIDGGRVRSVSFLASCYFRDASSSVWGVLKEELTKRKQRCAAVRNHAKILAFKLTDGRALSVEGSANMRSCNNLEQFAMIADEDLRAFHARWIDAAIDNEAAYSAPAKK
jgi:hypothetical protein